MVENEVLCAQNQLFQISCRFLDCLAKANVQPKIASNLGRDKLRSSLRTGSTHVLYIVVNGRMLIKFHCPAGRDSGKPPKLKDSTWQETEIRVSQYHSSFVKSGANVNEFT
jgi:hypothetical protein